MKYVVTYDKNNVNFQSNQEYNVMFVKAQQRYLCDLINELGYLYLNDALDMFGLKRIQQGQFLGWTKSIMTEVCPDGIITAEVFDNLVILHFSGLEKITLAKGHITK